MATFDKFQRPLEALRISVTDRCNLRCNYCMPKEAFQDHTFLGQNQLLTFDEIERLATIFVQLGVKKIRLTGGEPLLRPQIEDLIQRLSHIGEGVELALSTNGILLRRYASALRKAGLGRINVSLDAMDNTVSDKISGANQTAAHALDGIDAAMELGFTIKVNMVVQRGVNDLQILPMARHFASRRLPLRFIEFMDVGNCNDWNRNLVMPGAQVLEILKGEYDLESRTGHPSDVERRFTCRRMGASFGFINSVTAPFCRGCNRLRLSADGSLYTCLFARNGYPLGKFLRAGVPSEDLTAMIQNVWINRQDRYSELRSSSDSEDFGTKVEMSFIGG